MQEVSWNFTLPLYKARGSRERRKGLLGQRNIDFALLIPNCPLVHTVGMREKIDIVFLRGQKIYKIYSNVSPGRMRGALARDCLELPAGTAKELDFRVGQELSFSSKSENNITQE